MKMKRRMTAFFLSLCMGLLSLTGAENTVLASEKPESFTGENSQALEHVTGMDEDGNVYEIKDEGTPEIIGRNALTLSEGGQLVNFRTKDSSGQVTEYEDALTGEGGYTNGAYAADGAYLGMEDGKVKFMLSGVIGLADPADVTIVNLSETRSVSHYNVSGGRLIHRITQDLSASSYGSNLDNGTAPDYLREGVDYYSYDGHYFYTGENFDRMLEDYQRGNRDHSVNPSDPYFNYFQYLPLRSRTGYSAAELNSMINSRLQSESKLLDQGSNLVEDQDRFGTNALLVAGIAANESSWGMSGIAQSKNNIFGINAVDSSPGQSADSFESVEQCIREYTSDFLSAQYLTPDNWKYTGAFLGNKASGMNVRYASDPYWGEKAAAVAWNLDRDAGERDALSLTIGIKDVLPEGTRLNVRREPAVSGDTRIYQSPANPCMSFIILGEEQTEKGTFYRVQSDPALTADRTAIASSGEYDFDSMYLYVSADYLQIVSEQKLPYTDVKPSDWFFDEVSQVYREGLMTGKDGVTFAPYENLARAQFAVILYRLYGEPSIGDYTQTFPDVPEGQWYTDAVLWASRNGIVTGYGSTGMFGGSDNINREQMAVMMYRYANFLQMNTDRKADFSSYLDASSVSDFAREAMAWAVGNGIITGKYGETMLDPQGSATRAECAVIISRFYNLQG